MIPAIQKGFVRKIRGAAPCASGDGRQDDALFVQMSGMALRPASYGRFAGTRRAGVRIESRVAEVTPPTEAGEQS